MSLPLQDKQKNMVISLQDKQKISVNLSEKVFSVDPNKTLVWKAITIYNKRRVMTAANLGRSDVSFSGKKPWQQKGLGRARCGSRGSPLWRSGGNAHNKVSIDYRDKYKINKKEYRQAIRVMLSDHLRDNQIKVVSELDLKDAKTKSFKALMGELDFSKENKPNNWTGLIILNELTEDLFMASSNLYEYMICDARSIDPLSLKHASDVLITKEALEKIEEWLS